MILEHFYKPGHSPLEVALPEGKWEVGAVGENSYPSGTIEIKALLFQERNGTLEKVLQFKAPIEKGAATGWTVIKQCYREGMHYRKTLAEEDGGNQDCRWINHFIPAFSASKTIYGREFSNVILKRNLRAPHQFLSFGYNIADTFSRIDLRYYVAPEIDGFEAYPHTSWNGSPWHPAAIFQDEKKKAYVRRLQAWGDKFYEKVKAGFDGKLSEMIQLKPPLQTKAPPKPNKLSPIGERLKQLNDLFKQELISKQEYEQRRKEILGSL